MMQKLNLNEAIKGARWHLGEKFSLKFTIQKSISSISVVSLSKYKAADQNILHLKQRNYTEKEQNMQAIR